MTVDRDLIRYATNDGKRKGGPTWCDCLQCDKALEIGDEAQLLRDPKGFRRAVFCSVACQRQKYFDILIRKKKPRRRS